jgi:gluconokinase
MPKINLDCLLIMGVAGAGKTTVGKLLANSIGGTFMDGDDFHSGHNIEKMKRGIPLTDADRHRWLIEISRQIRDHPGPSKLVIACSALKGSYRKILGCDNFHLVYLKGN